MHITLSQASQQVYDIGHVAECLPNRAPFKAVSKAIRRRVEVGSARLDLQSASQKMMLLGRLVGRESAVLEVEFQADERASIGGSLFQHALLLYASVANNNDERGPMPLTNGWTDEQRAKHKHLLDLRRKVIAHFGYGGHYADGAWALDRLLLVRAPTGEMTQVDYGQRINYKENDAVILDEMLPLALEAVTRITAERDTDLDRLLSNLPPTDFAVFVKALGDPIDGVENLPPAMFLSLSAPPLSLTHTLHQAKPAPSFGADDGAQPSSG